MGFTAVRVRSFIFTFPHLGSETTVSTVLVKKNNEMKIATGIALIAY